MDQHFEKAKQLHLKPQRCTKITQFISEVSNAEINFPNINFKLE